VVVEGVELLVHLLCLKWDVVELEVVELEVFNHPHLEETLLILLLHQYLEQLTLAVAVEVVLQT
jgi:hypothetical protein